jgi:hypothetical protein
LACFLFHIRVNDIIRKSLFPFPKYKIRRLSSPVKDKTLGILSVYLDAKTKIHVKKSSRYPQFFSFPKKEILSSPALPTANHSLLSREGDEDKAEVDHTLLGAGMRIENAGLGDLGSEMAFGSGKSPACKSTC